MSAVVALLSTRGKTDTGALVRIEATGATESRSGKNQEEDCWRVSSHN